LSSSANRRPRVAGQRRRPTRPNGPGPDPTTTTAQQSGFVGVVEGPAESDGPDEGDGPVEAEGSREPAHDTGETTEPTEPTETAAHARGRRLLVPALALALSLALLATVLLVTRQDPEQRSRDASAARATARSTLEQVLSYNHATMTEQIPANQALLTGSFKDEFAATMTKTIVPLAQKDKTVVKARAYEVGVMSQTDDTVVVQAFVNQARTSDTQKEPSIDQNRVIATMKHVGNRWLVSALKAY